jgi:hypothetical protein
VAARVIDGQAVVITPSDSVLHTFNVSGTWLWERIASPVRLVDLLEELVKEFEVDREAAERDLVRFFESLRAKGLVKIASSPSEADEQSAMGEGA